MLFNSIHYILFLPIVVAAYFLLPMRFRWMFLLAASYYFYMCWRVEYILLIIASTLTDYGCGLAMGRHETRIGRRKWLVLSLVINLGVLGAFKYSNFAIGNLNQLFEWVDVTTRLPELGLLLPIGISFYTFQTLSYSIDVYRGRRKPERHLGIFALYVAFFPQLVAGPIERSERLLPQFHQQHAFSYDRLRMGLLLIGAGFFQKLVIADQVAPYVDAVYGNLGYYSSGTAVFATFLFAYQIFCDFAGYSSIAIGTAQIMGYDLMTNFRRPYFASSIPDFWRRWHISLSTWFRDYLYIPLGGNRVSRWRHYVNLMLVFTVSGLWHGANWTFAAWGALHGSYMVATLLIGRRLHVEARTRAVAAIYRVVQSLVTFALVLTAWVFFRAQTIGDAMGILIDSGQDLLAGNFSMLVKGPGLPMHEIHLTVALWAIVAMEAAHIFQTRWHLRETILRLPLPIRWTIYYVLLFSILVFGIVDGMEFIYFQF